MSESPDKRSDPPERPSAPAPVAAPAGAGSPTAGSTRARAAPDRPDLRRSRGGQLIVGRLREHGRARYQFRAEEDLSYYVKLLTSRGERTLWGRDLERALTASETQPKVGDLIGARRMGRRAVTITARERDAEGRIVRQEEHHAHRTRWVIERVKFFADRTRLARRVRDEQADVRESVRAHPELKSAFLSLRAAEAFAARRIADPNDRTRFLALMREAMAGSIQKGEPLPSVRLRERTERRAPAAPVPANRKRDEPTR
jgi:hypothetical protein